MAGHNKSRRFLERVNENFLTQVISKLTRRGSPLDLLPYKQEKLFEGVEVNDSLGCKDHMMDFKILREVSKTNSRITNLDFRTADFSLFRHLLSRSQW